MKIAEINASNYGSTGNIMLSITEHMRKKGHQVLVCYPATKRNFAKQVEGSYIIGNIYNRNICLQLSKLTGREDLFFRIATRLLLRKLVQFQPDVIHLHNIHGWYINFPMLFSYLKHRNIRVVWTFHDCWPTTGHCPHFDMIGCEKWKTECGTCPIYRDYPESRLDNAAILHRVKKDAFLHVRDLTIVTPSKWLAGIVSQSFLKDYPVEVIYNGINLDIFKPTPSNFRERYGLGDKAILLGVAFGWTERKGLDIFIRLARELDDQYRIVLVGTDETVDQQLPKNIISIHRTQERREMAEIYTAADILINPTREDTLPTVNMESLACGTPVLTFDTGGSPEILNESSGYVLRKDDYASLVKSVLKNKRNHLEANECRRRALSFSNMVMINNYERLLNG